MKIECVKEKLIDALSKTEKVVGKNLNLPILSCILIKTTSSSLVLRATNLEVGIEISIPAKVHAEGSVAVPGSILSSLLSQIKNEKNITLEVVDNNLVIKTSYVSTTIKALPADDFPSLPQAEEGRSVTLTPSMFVKGLKTVSYSASQSAVKPELASVYVYPQDETLIFVSTDSFRLAEKKMKFKNAKDFPPIIIPSKNIPDIIKTLEGLEEDVQVFFDKTQLVFVGNNTYLVSRVIDGTFPDYKQIIPKTFTTEVVALKEDVTNVFKTSHLFSDKFNQVGVGVDPESKKVLIKTKNNDVGEYSGSLDATITGEKVDVNFNQRYITDCFQSIDSDSLSLSFNGVSRPLVIQGVSDKSFFYLVMPMNK